MKKILLGLIIIYPLQAISADDSVYTWGAWSQGVKPAAGPVTHAATPAPVNLPDAKLRPNEHSLLVRSTERSAAQAVAAQTLAVHVAAAHALAAQAAAQAASNGAIATNVTVAPTSTINVNATRN